MFEGFLLQVNMAPKITTSSLRIFCMINLEKDCDYIH